MKQRKTLTLLMACLMFAGCLSAQHATRHFISLTGSDAYMNSFRPQPACDVLTLGGVGGTVGVGYQLHHNHFIFNVGLEFENSLLSNIAINDIRFDPTHIVKKGTTELLLNVNMNIPIMVGGEFGHFYFKAGVVPSLNVLGGGAVIGVINSNPQILDFDDIVAYRYMKIPQVYGRFEIGGSFGNFTPFDNPEQPRARFYLGVYMDMGLMKDRPKQAVGSYADYVPYAISNEAYNDVAIPVNIGLRFTCLFHLGK